jgi:polyribonucleotide nucleotidyltransferase
MFDIHSKVVETRGKQIAIETGLMARQAGGAVNIRLGDSVVLCCFTVEDRAREGIDFLPLTCDYIAKTYAAGRIPGGFFKREGKLTEKETLTSRLIDRPTRPLFPKGFRNESQLVAFVLSHDKVNDTDVLAMNGASCAAMLSDAPFAGPFGAVRIGRVDGELIAFPTFEQRESSDMDLIVAATREAICMVEGGFEQVSEADLLDALDYAHESIMPLLDIQEELAKECGKPNIVVTPPFVNEDIKAKVFEQFRSAIREAVTTTGKLERRLAVRAVREDVFAAINEFVGEDADPKETRTQTKKAVEALVKDILRTMLIEEKVRVDGRKPDEVRQIDVRVGVMPRPHGSALFTRGETQALVTATLATGEASQKIEGLEGDFERRFLLHYNFPPFSVNEVRFMRGPGRREIGHGALAHRSLTPLLPKEEDFPYVVRLVSDILESNGSSSMATVCGGSLAMMDAGVPMASPVAGIAMGLVKEGDDYVVLSDILGDEDHLGDMDFKLAGSEDGITAFQMDTKIQGISRQIMKEALEQANAGRKHILGEMANAITSARDDISEFAPRIHTIYINPDKIRDVIGPGGKVIRGMVEASGAKINVDDSGAVMIASSDEESCNKAIKMVKEITQEAEVGKLYLGLVKKVTDFGAFVEIFPGTDGLLHISELAMRRVERVTDVVNEGDEVLVRCIEVDRRSGKIRLSRKAALEQGQE